MKLFNFVKPSEFAVVGKDIKCNEIQREVCRINEFDRNGTVIGQNGLIHPKSNFKPYGYLIAEWPVIKRRVKIPIIHRDDFILASSVFDNPEFVEQIKDWDFLVTYSPADEDLSEYAAFLHVLHFVLTGSKTMEKYYEIHKNSLLGCNPESIFGNFVWQGELRVNINPNPEIF